MASDRSSFQRRSPKQARSRATLEAILEAAAQILERHGPAGLTTNDVAERAGVSIGTLYQYFPDKTAILVATARRELGAAPLPGRHGALMQALIAMIERFGAPGARTATIGPAKTAPSPQRKSRRTSWERRCADLAGQLIDLVTPVPASLRPIPIRIRRRGPPG